MPLVVFGTPTVLERSVREGTGRSTAAFIDATLALQAEICIGRVHLGSMAGAVVVPCSSSSANPFNLLLGLDRKMSDVSPYSTFQLFPCPSPQLFSGTLSYVLVGRNGFPFFIPSGTLLVT